MPGKFAVVGILVILLVVLIGMTGCNTCRICGLWVGEDKNNYTYFEFFSDGTYRSVFGIHSSWYINGNKITITTPFGAGTLTLQGEKLIDDIQGDVYVRSGGESQVTEPPVNNNHTTQSVITSVSIIYPTQTQTITITGHGFGQHNPYNGNSEYISVSDLTHPWSAGYLGSAVTLNVTSWSDTQIVISGFTGQYGKQGWALYSGDSIQITLWVTPDLTRPITYKTTIP